MSAAVFTYRNHPVEPPAHFLLKLGLACGLHAAMLGWVLHAPSGSLPVRPAQPVAVRLIEMPPLPRPAPMPAEAPKAAVQPQKRLTHHESAQTQARRLPAAMPAKAPASVADAPVVEAAAGTAQETAPSAPPMPSPAPVATAARFDADYLQNPAPAYPAISQRRGEEGKVLLLVRVSAKGEAEHVQIRQGSGFPRLDEAAVRTVRQWRFIPARLGAVDVAATVEVPIVFRLDG